MQNEMRLERTVKIIYHALQYILQPTSCRVVSFESSEKLSRSVQRPACLCLQMINIQCPDFNTITVDIQLLHV